MSQWIADPFKTAAGMVAKALPLHKWRRPDGLSSFLADMIALRKTLILCADCERKMPRKWIEKYQYVLVRGFMADENACDRCRTHGPANMYTSALNKYGQLCVERREAEQYMRAQRRAQLRAEERYLVRSH